MEFDFDAPSGEVRPLGSGEGANPTAAPTREQQAFATWREELNWEERMLEIVAVCYILEYALLPVQFLLPRRERLLLLQRLLSGNSTPIASVEAHLPRRGIEVELQLV